MICETPEYKEAIAEIRDKEKELAKLKVIRKELMHNIDTGVEILEPGEQLDKFQLVIARMRVKAMDNVLAMARKDNELLEQTIRSWREIVRII